MVIAEAMVTTFGSAWFGKKYPGCWLGKMPGPYGDGGVGLYPSIGAIGYAPYDAPGIEYPAMDGYPGGDVDPSVGASPAVRPMDAATTESEKMAAEADGSCTMGSPGVDTERPAEVVAGTRGKEPSTELGGAESVGEELGSTGEELDEVTGDEPIVDPDAITLEGAGTAVAAEEDGRRRSPRLGQGRTL